MEKNSEDKMEPSVSNTEDDSPNELIGTSSEVIRSPDIDKKETAREISEKDKLHGQSETPEKSVTVHGDHGDLQDSEQVEIVMISDDLQSNYTTQEKDTSDTISPGKTNVVGTDAVPHSQPSFLQSQHKNIRESETLSKPVNGSGRSVKSSTDNTEISEQETFKPPKKKSKTETHSVVDISEGDTLDKEKAVEVIQIDPPVDDTKSDNESQSNIVPESTDIEIIETKDTEMKQSKSDFRVAQAKAIADVILIDEPNTDSRGSAATDDSVIFVDESMKENSSDTVQPR